MDPQEVRQCLTGPIGSINTPFNRDGSVDYQSLRNEIDFVVEAGSRTVLLTAGDSHYTCLSDEEIAQVTRTTCEQTARRAMVVAADRLHSTSRAVEFARFARDLGADVLMVLPPNWASSCVPRTLTEHYQAVSKHLPVMLVTNVFGAQGADFGLETVKLTLQQCDRVVAIKDDLAGDFARRLCLLAHTRCAIISGGRESHHLSMWPYGCDGLMSPFMCFKPEIAHAYWRCLQANDIAGAGEVIGRYEVPYFDFICQLPGGWNAGYHATLELFGVAKRWRRKPYYSLNDAEVDALAQFLKDRGLLP